MESRPLSCGLESGLVSCKSSNLAFESSGTESGPSPCGLESGPLYGVTDVESEFGSMESVGGMESGLELVSTGRGGSDSKRTSCEEGDCDLGEG